jgi:hypothetical protein
MNSLVKGGIAAGTLMIGGAALVIGAGLAKADETQMGFSNPTAIEIEHTICNAFDHGASNMQIGQALLKAGMQPMRAGMYVVDATYTYCPWNISKLPDGGSPKP